MDHKHKRTIVSGQAESNTGIKSAPPPSRDIFVYRVHKETITEQLHQHLVDNEIEVRGLECVSHDDSVNKSFKLIVPVTDYDKVFNGALTVAQRYLC